VPRRGNLRWWIAGVLFASTVINYIDRQTLSLLAPELKLRYHWTNSDYATLAIAFRIMYAIGQTGFGRLVDRIGTRAGLTLTVACYSVVSILTSLANGLASFLGFRALLGLTESGNWPGAAKAVAEWFPKRERGLATALFDSGSSIGGAIAPFVVFAVYQHFGLHLTFVVPGLLGIVWLIFWRRLYHPPESHPKISQDELQMILADRDKHHAASGQSSIASLLRQPKTWGVIIARGFTDPVWFFITDWFPIYLVSKGFTLKTGLFAFWIPFLAADLGNFFGGWLSGLLIARGWQLIASRKAVTVLGGVGVLLIIPTVFTTNLWVITLLFAVATFCYGCFTTIANVLPSDLYAGNSVATVSGMSGTAASMGTVFAFLFIGFLTDSRAPASTHVFDPIVIVAGLIPFLGMVLVLLLIKNQAPSTQHSLT
jgi:MFS transporter, ACS family, hexuronate transporter